MSDETTEIEVVTVEPGGNVVSVLDPALTGYIKGSGAGVFTGVASIPQSDLTLATDLAAVEGLAGTGIAVRTASNTWANRTLVAGVGISLTNADGVSGDITITATGTVTPDLTAIEALASQGIPVRTATDTWALRNIIGTANRTTITNGDGVLGNPAVDISAAYVGQATITTVGTIATGTWAASFPNTGGVSSTGELGVRTATNTARSISIAAPSSAGVQLQGVDLQASVPSTATTSWASYRSIATTAAAAFTITDFVHFYAVGAAKGAGSTLTNAYAFRADNTAAVGTNNYGYWSNIAQAATTYQVYMSGTAQSIFIGPVGIGSVNAQDALNGQGAMLLLGGTGAHPSTLTGLFGSKLDFTAPSTATASATGYDAILRSAAAAFTITSLNLFQARAVGAGAGSTITNVRGFYALNAIALGTNNYGFYSDINQAATTYQLHMAGTAQSVFFGPVGIGGSAADATNLGGAFVLMGNAGTHPGTTTSIYGVKLDYTAPSTATALAAGYWAQVRTAASAFTVTSLALFLAAGAVQGAGSTISNLRGFYAANAIAVGTNNYGFYSDINTATTTWQLYMAGTAQSFFGGVIGVAGLAAADNRAVNIRLTTLVASAANVSGVVVSGAGEAGATSSIVGYSSQSTTAASAFTVTNLIHFAADGSAKGAGSTITNVIGFRATNGFSQGTNNYGFWSDIPQAANTFQLYMSGSATSYFAGAVGILNNTSSVNSAMLFMGVGNNHIGTAANLQGYYHNLVAPATTTTEYTAFYGVVQTANSAFTLTDLHVFKAHAVTKGAASTITNIRGFYAASGLVATAGSVTGFYCDINAAAGVRQMNMSGTADCAFAGAIVMAVAAVVEASFTITYSASMTPAAASGNEQIISATDGVAFTLNAPSGPRTGQYLEITIRNATAGALGAATWNAVYKMTAWVQPATGTSRTIVFRYNGTNWVEKGRTAADVPN